MPSGSACWQAIGREASVPPSSWTVVSIAVRWSLISVVHVLGAVVVV